MRLLKAVADKAKRAIEDTPDETPNAGSFLAVAKSSDAVAPRLNINVSRMDTPSPNSFLAIAKSSDVDAPQPSMRELCPQRYANGVGIISQLGRSCGKAQM